MAEGKLEREWLADGKIGAERDDAAKKSGCCSWRGDNKEDGRSVAAASGEEEE